MPGTRWRCRGRLLERQHAQHRAEVHEEQRGEHAGADAVCGDESRADRPLIACAQHQQRAYGHAGGEQVARRRRAQQSVELLVKMPQSVNVMVVATMDSK